MPVGSRSQHGDTPDGPPALPTWVGAYESCPGRLVFIEDGNTDAWIATDYTVDVWP